jgi:hypothetical protein
MTVSVIYGEGDWALIFTSGSESWAFLDDDTAYFLIDGKRQEAMFARGDREVDGGDVTEQNIVVLDKSFRAQLKNAETVRVKIGQHVLDITEAVDEEIRLVERNI